MLPLRMGAVLAMLAGALSLSVTDTANATTIYTPSVHIVRDCSADVTLPLRAFFDAVPSGSTVRLPRRACYRIEREVSIHGKDRVTLEGQGAMLRRTTSSSAGLRHPRSNAMLRFTDMTRSSISGVHLLGSNTVSDKPDLRPAYGAWDGRHAFDHGIALIGVQDFTIADTTIDAVFGDGVYIGGSDANGRSTRVRVSNVVVDRNGRQGIAITSAKGVLLDRVTIAHSRRSGLDMEPHPDDTVAQIEVTHSTITSRLLAITGAGPGIVNDVFIHDNTVRRSALPFIHDRPGGHARQRHGWHVVDNTIVATVSSSAPAMKFSNTDDVLVHGNHVDFGRGARLAVLTSNTQGTVQCNRFTGAIPDFVTIGLGSVVRVHANSRTDREPACADPAAPGWSRAAQTSTTKDSGRAQPAASPTAKQGREEMAPTASAASHAPREKSPNEPSQLHDRGMAAQLSDSVPVQLSAGVLVLLVIALLSRKFISRDRH